METSSIQHNDRHQPAVVRLLSMRGAAIAEESALVAVGVEAEVLELANAGAQGAFGYIGVEVEHRVARSRARSKVASRVAVCGREGGDQLWANLVGFGPDAGAQRRSDIAAPRAEPLHRRDGGLDHSG